MLRVRRLSTLAALAASLAAAPAGAQVLDDLPAALRPLPLPAQLTPDAAASPSVEPAARSGRPVWLLPLAGMVAGAVIYPMVVDGSCEDRDCMLYIPEPVTGAIVGLLGGITVEVFLMALEEVRGDGAPSALLRSVPGDVSAPPDVPSS